MVKLVNFLTQPLERQIETLTWRNSLNVAHWFQIKHIDLDVHKKWLAGLKESKPKTIAFFIEFEKLFVGVTYFHSIDYALKHTDWGIYVHDPAMRGKGIGGAALQKSLEYASNDMNMEKIFIEVLGSNLAALKVYENFGFSRSCAHGNVIRAERRLGE